MCFPFLIALAHIHLTAGDGIQDFSRIAVEFYVDGLTFY